jgi:hypothetical protein
MSKPLVAAFGGNEKSTHREDQHSCQTFGVRWKELVCQLNLWRMELFKYMKACHGVAGSNGVRRHCRHHAVATRHL